VKEERIACLRRGAVGNDEEQEDAGRETDVSNGINGTYEARKSPRTNPITFHLSLFTAALARR